ncbi:MAG: NDP-sugar synthase [Acidimicrobiia bacterium]|nr:NDP-sugar synthase [Acidimicrobiia bacterium]
MRSVVLVGGFGTRLRPLTASTPKQMLPLVDRPMIEWVLAGLARHGIDEAVLALGYRPEAFQRAYPDSVCAGVRLVYAVEPEPLDTAGAVGFAAAEAGIDERFVVVNGDVLTDLDLSALLELHEDAHRRLGAEGTIALHRVADPSAFGVVPTDADGRVVAFVEKPPPGEAPTDLINAGTYILEPSVLDRVEAGRRVSVEREVFPAMVADRTLFAHDDGGVYWIDTGTPAQYLDAMLDLVEGRRGYRPDAVSATATVDPSAVVERSVVMAGATVGAAAIVRNSALLPGASVADGATVEDSVVGPGAEIGSGAGVIGGSVLGDGVVVEAGTVVDGQRIPDPEGA